MSYTLSNLDLYCGKSMMDNLIPTFVTAVPVPDCGNDQSYHDYVEGAGAPYAFVFGTEKLRGVAAVQTALGKVVGTPVTCQQSDALPTRELGSSQEEEEYIPD